MGIKIGRVAERTVVAIANTRLVSKVASDICQSRGS